MNRRTFGWMLLAAAVIVSGCGTGYTWRPKVPAKMRTVFVPTFRNESNLTEIGPVMSRQLLREFQREGTFKIRSEDKAAVEVQGIVKSVSAGSIAYDRRSGLRTSAYELTAKVEISVIDKLNGKVLVNNREYEPRTTFVSGNDIDTAERDASGRLADELSRMVVDDILNLKW